MNNVESDAMCAIDRNCNKTLWKPIAGSADAANKASL